MRAKKPKYTETATCHNPERLIGVTVNIFKKPTTREGFEGSAAIDKLLSFDEETKIGTYEVTFAAKGEKRTREVFLGKAAKRVKTKEEEDEY